MNNLFVLGAWQALPRDLIHFTGELYLPLPLINLPEQQC